MTVTAPETAGHATARIAALDLARGAALLAMVVFHFARDLEFFGYVAPGLTMTGGWPVFARLIAGSFLFLAGASLWLAHGTGIRRRAFLRRLGMIAGAAAVVSVATYVALPEAWIFFGILHMIATASLAGLVFVRLPTAITLAAAIAAAALPRLVADPIFSAPGLVWLGLGSEVPRSMDFVPFFPWIAPCLLGLAVARLAGRAGFWDWLRRRPTPGTVWQALAFPGRHSLAVYLIHQPVLVGLLWMAARIGV